MSWKATAYVKELSRCPDGAPLSRLHKELLLVLSDYHRTDSRVMWPSQKTLASDCLAKVRQIQRELDYCCEHGILDRQQRKTGKGNITDYRFIDLDGRFSAKDDSRSSFAGTPKGDSGSSFEAPPKDGSQSSFEENLPSAKDDQRTTGKTPKDDQRTTVALRNKEEQEPVKTQPVCADRPEADPRHRPVRDAVTRLQKHELDDVTWDGAAAKRLSELLASKPSLSAEKLVLCVVHRWLSPDRNPAEHPRKWLPSLCEYQAGPVNRFGDLVRYQVEEVDRLLAIACGAAVRTERLPLEAEPAALAEITVETIPTSSAADWTGNPPEQLWARLQAFLGQRINRASYETWLKPPRQESFDAERLLLTVRVPAPEFVTMADKYAEVLREGVLALGLPIARIRLWTGEAAKRAGA